MTRFALCLTLCFIALLSAGCASTQPPRDERQTRLPQISLTGNAFDGVKIVIEPTVYILKPHDYGYGWKMEDVIKATVSSVDGGLSFDAKLSHPLLPTGELSNNLVGEISYKEMEGVGHMKIITICVMLADADRGALVRQYLVVNDRVYKLNPVTFRFGDDEYLQKRIMYP